MITNITKAICISEELGMFGDDLYLILGETLVEITTNDGNKEKAILKDYIEPKDIGTYPQLVFMRSNKEKFTLYISQIRWLEEINGNL